MRVERGERPAMLRATQELLVVAEDVDLAALDAAAHDLELLAALTRRHGPHGESGVLSAAARLLAALREARDG